MVVEAHRRREAVGDGGHGDGLADGNAGIVGAGERRSGRIVAAGFGIEIVKVSRTGLMKGYSVASSAGVAQIVR